MDSKHRLRDEYPSNKLLSLRSPSDGAAVSHSGAVRVLSSSLTAETIDACWKASVFLSTVALTLNIRPYWVSSCHCVEKCYVCDIVVNSENKACTRGVIPDRWLRTRLIKTVVQAFNSCRLDYCNSCLLFSVADNLLQRLQSVQNAAARLITITVSEN